MWFWSRTLLTPSSAPWSAHDVGAVTLVFDHAEHGVDVTTNGLESVRGRRLVFRFHARKYTPPGWGRDGPGSVLSVGRNGAGKLGFVNLPLLEEDLFHTPGGDDGADHAKGREIRDVDEHRPLEDSERQAADQDDAVVER